MDLIAICIPTYKRPKYLSSLLHSLTKIQINDFSHCVIVVDNDSDGSGQTVVSSYQSQFQNLIYAIEPERGIASARNRLILIAHQQQVDYLVFVDDDEWVEPDWLTHLVQQLRKSQSHAVAGPVIADYEEGVPPWVRQGKFFERRRYPSGSEIQRLGIGNVLLPRSWLCNIEKPFDRRFNLTGGEDSYLLLHLYSLGLRMVWSDEAIVHEIIPTSRATMRFLLQREYRIGITISQRVNLLTPTWKQRSLRIIRALARVGVGMLLLLPSLVVGRAALVKSLCHCAGGWGSVAGLFGANYEQYQVIHGQ